MHERTSSSLLMIAIICTVLALLTFIVSKSFAVQAV